jgi:hypothetical protein
MTPGEGLPTFTFTDPASWESYWTEQWEGERELPSVDFETHVVVGVAAIGSQTCGLQIRSHGVGDARGSTAIYADFEDPSGNCRVRCSGQFQVGVIYAVPRDAGTPSVCARLIDTCG